MRETTVLLRPARAGKRLVDLSRFFILWFLRVCQTQGPHFFFTVTVKPQLAELFAGSFVVQLTGVVPIGKLDPDAGVHVTVTGLQLSVAVTV